MKIRQGFVSNSSSSSFIICEDGAENIKSKGIKIYKIKDIWEEYGRLCSIWYNTKLIPEFMLGSNLDPEGFLYKVEKLVRERPNDYITENLEDDWLNDCCIDMSDYGLFERI